MAKSKIIKELVNEDISIEKALYRLLLMANDIEDDQLKNWVEKELNGYMPEDELPSYRIKTSYNIRYDGFNGRYQVKNNPIPIYSFPEEYREAIKAIHIYKGISSIEKNVEEEDTLKKDLTSFASDIYSSSGIKCYEIRALLDSGELSNILRSIKTKIVNILCKLENVFGNLDDLDIDIEEVDKKRLNAVTKEINILINDNSIKIGENNKITKSDFSVKG